MNCPYCRNKVSGRGWAHHSQICEERKRIRSEHASRIAPVIAEDHADDCPEKALEDMSKGELILYLTMGDIEHYPKSKKKDLLKISNSD